MGYRKVGYLEQALYIIKWKLSSHKRRKAHKRRKVIMYVRPGLGSSKYVGPKSDDKAE